MDSLRKYKRVEVISTKFSDHNALKLEINYKKKAGITTNTWRLNNMLLKNNCLREEIERKIKRYIEINDNDSTTYQNFWNMAIVVLRGKFISLQAYFQKQEGAQKNNPTFHLKKTRKGRTNAA